MKKRCFFRVQLVAFLVFHCFVGVGIHLRAAANEPVITVNGQVATGMNVQVIGQAIVSLSTSFPQGVIFYTTNGVAPTFNDKQYSSSFSITNSTTLRAIAYSSSLTESAEREPLFIEVVPKYALSIKTTLAEVTSDPPPGHYAAGTPVTVTLVRVKRADGVFEGWTGTVSGTNTTITFVMDQDELVIPIVKPVVAVNVVGNGQVVADPPTLDQQPFFNDRWHNPRSLLTAIPAPGFRFVRWDVNQAQSGSLPFLLLTPSNASPAMVAVPATWQGPDLLKPITALFAPLASNENSLTILKTDGDGFVSLAPPRNFFTNGEVVRLTATPKNNWMAFKGWSGAISSKALEINLVMDGNKTVTANFLGKEKVIERVAGTPVIPGDHITPRDQEGNYYLDFGSWYQAIGPSENWNLHAFNGKIDVRAGASVASDLIYMPKYFSDTPLEVWAISRDGVLQWRRTNIYARVVLDSEDRAYVTTQTNTFLRLDPQTGETLWERPGNTVIVGAEDRVYSFLRNQIKIYNSDGDLLSSGATESTIGGPPILDPSGDIFVSFTNGVARLRPGGEVVWKSDQPLLNLLIADGEILGESENRLYALNAETGELVWTSAEILVQRFSWSTWSVDHSGELMIGIVPDSGDYPFELIVRVQIDAGLSATSAWPWAGGDVLNRAKTQWFAPPRLTFLKTKEGALQLVVGQTTRPTTIYESENLIDWDVVTDLPPGGYLNLDTGSGSRFFKAVTQP
jgi:outer membrane protein assembly factor BamB